MTWAFEQEKRKWFGTEAGKFLRESDIQPRTCNSIMRHFLFQNNPYTGHMYPWKMEGITKELELIAEDELPIAGLGDKGRKDLQKVLDDNKPTE